VFGALAGAVVVVSASLTPGCYTTQLGLLRSGLDSLRTQVDTLTVRDSVAYRVVADTRRELASQRDLLLSTRASSGSTMQEMFDQMSRLEGKLDDVMHRFSDFSARATSGASATPPPAVANATPPVTGAAAPPVTNPPAGGPTAPQLYDTATRDLTEGRYPLALQGYRDLLARYPSVDLAPGAQYGVGECFFAEAAFDSAAVEYARVSERWPKGDRTPAALYKLGLCQDRLGRAADAKKTFEDLAHRFPSSSEAALARERLGAGRH
jgi:tol-pal system protein YbgF